MKRNPYAEFQNGNIAPGKLPFFLKAVPFFLSTVLFYSGFFIFLTPFPLLMMRLFPGVLKRWFYFAFFINIVLAVLLVREPISIVVFFLMILSAWCLPVFLIHLKFKPDLSILSTSLVILFSAIIIMSVHSFYAQTTPIAYLESQINKSSEEATRLLEALGQKEIPKAAELKKTVFEQGFFMLFAFFILSVWGNLILVFRSPVLALHQRLNVAPDYFRCWKVTDHLIWLLLLFGACVVFLKGVWAVVALNGLKIVLIPYALQGVAIIAFFLNKWKVEGIFRVLLYLVIISFVSPLIVILGVSDLWFDFRSKFGQISET